MIELKELTLGYGQRTLLETVNARITGGQLVALLGRNGTGKSTLLRAMMGLEKPQSGEITLQGKNIASLKPEKLARNISFVTTDKVRIANLRYKDVVALGRTLISCTSNVTDSFRKSLSICPLATISGVGSVYICGLSMSMMESQSDKAMSRS